MLEVAKRIYQIMLLLLGISHMIRFTQYAQKGEWKTNLLQLGFAILAISMFLNTL